MDNQGSHYNHFRRNEGDMENPERKDLDVKIFKIFKILKKHLKKHLKILHYWNQWGNSFLEIHL